MTEIDRVTGEDKELHLQQICIPTRQNKSTIHLRGHKCCSFIQHDTRQCVTRDATSGFYGCHGYTVTWNSDVTSDDDEVDVGGMTRTRFAAGCPCVDDPSVWFWNEHIYGLPVHRRIGNTTLVWCTLTHPQTIPT